MAVEPQLKQKIGRGAEAHARLCQLPWSLMETARMMRPTDTLEEKERELAILEQQCKSRSG